MIKIENVETYGWEAAIRGMRMPLNSWDKSDSYWGLAEDPSPINPNDEVRFFLGENDLGLAKRLANAGNDHSKFLRMINVSMDITAPTYWVAEHDTYKVATVRNSCSFMHKGVSKPFEINDFSVPDDRIYYLLNPIEKKSYELKYPYETDKYKIYTTFNGRDYKVYRNGRIVSCEHTVTDNFGAGRTRTFPEKECKPSINSDGYFALNIGGRNGERWLLHRLVATVWLDNDSDAGTVNHIDGDKGNNCVENLEWCSRSDNIKKGFESGLYDENQLHRGYHAWKAGMKFDPLLKAQILEDYGNGMQPKELEGKYNIQRRTINNMLYAQSSENADLYMLAYTWEEIIKNLNILRDEYLETGDEKCFEAIRQLLPSGYNVRYTWQGNYAVLRNMYHSRKTHRLKEWRDFCEWIETLPYAKELIIGDKT